MGLPPARQEYRDDAEPSSSALLLDDIDYPEELPAYEDVQPLSADLDNIPRPAPRTSK
jgi:hypothetical protein